MSNNLKKSKKVNGIKTNTVVLEKNEEDLVINDNFINSFVDRKVLNDAYEKILNFMFDEEKTGGYIQMATGIGKTKVIAALINWLFQNKKENERKICLLASHRLMLNEQLLNNIVNVIKFFNEGKKNYAIINCSSDYNIGKGIGKTGGNLINLKPQPTSEYIKEHKDQDIFIVTTQTSIERVVNNLSKNEIRTDLVVLDESHKFTKGGKREPYLLTINKNSKKTIAFSATQNDIVTENFHNIFTFNFCDAANPIYDYVTMGELAMIKTEQNYDGVNPNKVIVNKKNLPTKVVNGVVEIIKDFHNEGKKTRLLATCGENVKTVEVSAQKLSKVLKDIPILTAASNTYEINEDTGIKEKIGGCAEWKDGKKVEMWKNGKKTEMSKKKFLDKIKELNNDPNSEYIILYAMMLSEGIDISGLNAVATFRRLSICEFMQLWGRGARKEENKKKFMFYAPFYYLTNKPEESIDNYESIIGEIDGYYKKYIISNEYEPTVTGFDKSKGTKPNDPILGDVYSLKKEKVKIIRGLKQIEEFIRSTHENKFYKNLEERCNEIYNECLEKVIKNDNLKRYYKIFEVEPYVKELDSLKECDDYNNLTEKYKVIADSLIDKMKRKVEFYK